METDLSYDIWSKVLNFQHGQREDNTGSLHPQQESRFTLCNKS